MSDSLGALPLVWPGYIHPDLLPNPDRATALAAPLSSFPAWFLVVTCDGCGRESWENQANLPQLADRPVRDVIALVRCPACGGSKHRSAELVSHQPGSERWETRRRISLG